MSAPERRDYRVAIVGAGIMGLFTAYHVARRGGGPVLVVDRGYLSSGASGRNGGGVRQQWENPETVRLARESVAVYRRFPHDFGYNVWFRQGGYLFLATSNPEWKHLERVHRSVTGEGLDARRLRPDEVGRYVPELRTDGVVGATFLRTDGTLYPFPAIWGLYEAAQQLGVEVRLGVEALGVTAENGRVTGLTTSRGAVRAATVVNAAGGWASEFSARSGLRVENRPTRHEILATEALKPFLDPMVVRLSDGLYFSQTMRGEIVGGLTVPHPPGVSGGVPSSPAFLGSMARALTELVPRLASVSVLRAWSGFYDETPDGFPIVGEDPNLRGFVHANGFGGHGFMLAPAASTRVARMILGEPTDLDPGHFSPARFANGRVAPRSESLQPG